MRGRREIIITSHRPVTSSDFKQERQFFRRSVSTFLQLVVALLGSSNFNNIRHVVRNLSTAPPPPLPALPPFFLHQQQTLIQNKQIISQRHCPQRARLFEAGQCVQNEIKMKPNHSYFRMVTKPVKLFCSCFCSLFWTRPYTTLNSIPIILKLLTNRNILLIYLVTIYEQKTKDCERSGSYQHKVKHLLCPSLCTDVPHPSEKIATTIFSATQQVKFVWYSLHNTFRKSS